MNLLKAKEILKSLEMDYDEFFSKEDFEAIKTIYKAIDVLENMVNTDDANIYLNEAWKLIKENK